METATEMNSNWHLLVCDLSPAQGGKGLDQVQIGWNLGAFFPQAAQQVGFRVLPAGVQKHREDMRRQTRQQTSLDQGRLTAARGTVKHADAKGLVRIKLFDPRFPEANAVG